jgi:hypothetical protein
MMQHIDEHAKIKFVVGKGQVHTIELGQFDVGVRANHNLNPFKTQIRAEHLHLLCQTAIAAAYVKSLQPTRREHVDERPSQHHHPAIENEIPMQWLNNRFGSSLLPVILLHWLSIARHLNSFCLARPARREV